MTNTKTGATFTIPTALIEMCKQTYGTTNTSAAITNALTDFLLLPYKEQTLDTFAIHQLLPDVEDRKATKKITLRLDSNLRNVMEELAGRNTLAQTAQLMISRTLYALQQGRSVSSNTVLLYILGNKRNPQMQRALKNIKDTAQGVNWKTSVETCAGVLGIYAKSKFADTEILNDNDWKKVNLYRAIQKNPRRLITLARALKVDETTFDAQKDLLNCAEESKQINYEAAAAYLYLNKNSYRHEGTKLDSTASNARYYKVLSAINPLHHRMNQKDSTGKATEFQNTDLIKIIEKNRRKKDVLFVIDPPYLDTDLYNTASKKFGETEHKKLSHLLYLVKKNNGNNFIYFCRITASKKDQSKPNAADWDRHMKGRIDDLYYGQGFFYIDVKLDDATIERVITSFNFDGATAYGSTSAHHGNPSTLPLDEKGGKLECADTPATTEQAMK